MPGFKESTKYLGRSGTSQYIYIYIHSGLRVDGTIPKRLFIMFIWIPYIKDILGFVPSTLNPL